VSSPATGGGPCDPLPTDDPERSDGKSADSRSSKATSNSLASRCRGADVRRIKVVLARNPHVREQGVASGIGQRRAHAVRIGGLSHGADRPVRGEDAGQHEIATVQTTAAIDSAVGMVNLTPCWSMLRANGSEALDLLAQPAKGV
jgi:hypothetical protein